MIRIALVIVFALLFSGCRTDAEAEAKLKAFINKYGSTTVYTCESGFLVHRYYELGNEYATVITNDADVPTRCTQDVNITVKETVATGSLVGDVK